jgi:hypothetical protein
MVSKEINTHPVSNARLEQPEFMPVVQPPCSVMRAWPSFAITSIWSFAMARFE